MDLETTISEKGIIQIPKNLLNDLGIKPGGKIFISIKNVSDQKSGIEKFFGMGKRKAKKQAEDIDTLIIQAVSENDQY